MSQVVFSTHSAEKIAVERALHRERELLRAEREERIRRGASLIDDADWWKGEMAKLEAWWDYCDRALLDKHRGDFPLLAEAPPPANPPFPRTRSMLGDQAAGQALVDELGRLLLDIAVLVTLQASIGVPLAVEEALLRSRLAAARKRTPRPLVPVLSEQGNDGLAGDGGEGNVDTDAAPPPRPKPRGR